VAAARLAPALILAALALPGCVERVLLLRTDPPGARVSVNGVPLGASPVEWTFLHYGTVRLEAEPLDADGSGAPDTRRAVLDFPLSPPWYQWPGIDFFADNLWPWTVVDRHEAVIVLPPAPDPDDPHEGQEELRRLERELRERAREERRKALAIPPAADGKR
jgi:hypothetical protein